MIDKIGVIYQDQNSLGFLLGLRDRLECEATLIAPPSAIGKSRELTCKQARNAWLFFTKKGVDLILRFTDADGSRWQKVQRAERAVFPDEAKSLCVCGVAVNNTEEWLGLDLGYISKELGLPVSELENAAHRTDRIKRAIARRVRGGESSSSVVAAIVRDAPVSVFRKWLQHDSFGKFYAECRAASARDDCDTPNELDEGADA